MGNTASDRKNARFYGLKLSKNTDADIIEQLDQQESIQGYLKRLIREDMKGANTMETYYITAESFGSEIPSNWESIANRLNAIIDDQDISGDHDAVNQLWEDFWNGDLYWYAVMLDSDDTDWGTGSSDREKAIRMAADCRVSGHPDAYVAVIQEGTDPVCVEEIREF